MGLGTCIIGIYDCVKLREILHIPQEKQIASFIAVGRAADSTIRVKDRKPLEQISRFV